MADVPGVRAIRYDPEARCRPARTAPRCCAPFLATGEVVAAAATLPKLRLVQLLTAGAEAWIGHLPARRALGLPRRARRRDRRVGRRHPARDLSASPAVRRPGRRRWDYHPTEELAGKRVLVIGAGDVAENTRPGSRPSRSRPRWSAAAPATACTRSTRCPTCSRTTTRV